MKKKGYFRRLFNTLPRKHYLIIGVCLILILSCSNIFISYFIKGMLDCAIEKNLNRFFYMLYFLLGIMVINISFTYLRTRILGKYSETGVKTLRELIGTKINKLDFQTLYNNHSGDYVSRATNDVSRVRNFISVTMPLLISIPVTGILALAYLLILSWKLTLISLALIPLLIVVVGLFSKPLGSISKKLQEKLGHVNSIVQDYIKGVEVSKAYNLEDVLGDSYNGAVNESVKCGMQLAKRRSILNAFAELLGFFPFFITFFLGGYYVIHNEMSEGSLLAFINLLNPVVNAITRYPRLFAQAKVDLASGSRIFEIIDSNEERNDGKDFEINGAENIIEFKNVNFSYPGKNDLVLNNLNIKIKKGESVAIVGPSGGGKSTVIRMLLGYYNNYEGDIVISGHELKEWNINCLRDKMALVSQDTFLFPESIKDNISYGKIGIDEEGIINAAKLANASTFIEDFETGYDTEIGELGNKLSGGQKQRISIARAICKDADILLLDEATSALDNESEFLVQEALDRLMENKSSIVIAHRLSTIKNVDRILVIDNGVLVEEGTHNELMEIDGIYKDLYNKQMKIESNDEGMVA